MSELKAGVLVTPHNEGMCFHRCSNVIAVAEGETEFYLKSEADKVITRHKYKRCLAMADWCDSEMNYWYDRIMLEQCPRFKFYEKWRKRWLALAEEPTWAKFLRLIHKEEK